MLFTFFRFENVAKKVLLDIFFFLNVMPRNTDRMPFQKAIWHRRHVLFIWLHHQVLELIENWSIKAFLLKSLTEFTVRKVQCQNQKRKEKGQYSNLY